MLSAFFIFLFCSFASKDIILTRTHIWHPQTKRKENPYHCHQQKVGHPHHSMCSIIGSSCNLHSPSSLVTHSEERYITIFRMQNNSQIIICENISRRWSALTLRFCSSHACFYYTLFPFLTCFRVPHGWPSTTQDRPRTHEWSGALLAYSTPLTLRPQRFG